MMSSDVWIAEDMAVFYMGTPWRAMRKGTCRVLGRGRFCGAVCGNEELGADNEFFAFLRNHISKTLDKSEKSCIFAITILTTRAEKQRTRVELFLCRDADRPEV